MLFHADGGAEHRQQMQGRSLPTLSSCDVQDQAHMGELSPSTTTSQTKPPNPLLVPLALPCTQMHPPEQGTAPAMADTALRLTEWRNCAIIQREKAPKSTAP